MEISKRSVGNKQRGIVVWLSGLPCSGKTTIGLGLENHLLEEGFIVRMLDGDVTRKGICSDLGFSEHDRKENIRRIAEIAKLLAETGIVTICAFITPTEDLRQLARQIIGDGQLISVFVDTPLEVCENRDVKGMYKKARKGEIAEFTGVSAPFEVPVAPGLVLSTAHSSPDASIKELYEYLLPIIDRNEK
jgi:adenylylsulfate kinase